MQDNCSRHSKQVAGISDMNQLAIAVGDLHYETLSIFLDKLSDKLFADATKDRAADKKQLASLLEAAARNLFYAQRQIEGAWEVCKPFMDKTDNNG